METNNPQHKNHLVINVAMIVLAALLTLLAYHYFFGRVRNTYSDDAQVQQLVIPVNVRVGGYLQAIRFQEFAPVSKGDTLALIDPIDYQYQLDMALAGLEDAEANLTVLNSSVATLENAQSIAEANLKETEARLWNARQNYNRFDKLVQENSATQQQFDQIKSEYESLQARYMAMIKGTEGAKLSTLEARSKIKAAEARIKHAQAQVDIAQQNLEYTVIIAPCDGIAGRKNIQKGQLVQQGQTLLQVVDNSEKWITVNFLEKQMKEVTIGKKVRIHVDAVTDTDFYGTIESIAGATGSVFSMVPTDNATGNFVKVQQRIPVRVALSAADGTPLELLKAGMNAEVFVE